jgi:hypothetical protein
MAELLAAFDNPPRAIPTEQWGQMRAALSEFLDRVASFYDDYADDEADDVRQFLLAAAARLVEADGLYHVQAMNLIETMAAVAYWLMQAETSAWDADTLAKLVTIRNMHPDWMMKGEDPQPDLQAT